MAHSILADAPSSLNGSCRLLTVGQVHALYGISPNTIRSLCESGVIETTRLGLNGWRRIVASSVVAYLGIRKQEDNSNDRIIVGYHRKSSGTKADLEVGVRELREHMSTTYGIGVPTIFADLASHINFDGRKQFMKMLDLVFEGKVSTIVILYKDRLSRLPIHSFLNKVCEKFGTTITYVNDSDEENTDSIRECMDDLLSFSHTVSCRIYSKRSAEKKRFHLSDAIEEVIRKGIESGKANKDILAELNAKKLYAVTKDGTPKHMSLAYLHILIQKRNQILNCGGGGKEVANFIATNTTNSNGVISKKDMYAKYVVYCKRNNITPFNQYTFGKVLQSIGIKQVKTTRNNKTFRGWNNISWVK